MTHVPVGESDLGDLRAEVRTRAVREAPHTSTSRCASDGRVEAHDEGALPGAPNDLLQLLIGDVADRVDVLHHVRGEGRTSYQRVHTLLRQVENAQLLIRGAREPPTVIVAAGEDEQSMVPSVAAGAVGELDEALLVQDVQAGNHCLRRVAGVAARRTSPRSSAGSSASARTGLASR